MKGIVQWFNQLRGYGLIKSEDGTDVFVHRSALPYGTRIHEKDHVEYRILLSHQGPKAINIKKITSL